MRRTVWRLLAAASLIAIAGGATRPHYGGTLRIQTKDRSAPRDLQFDTLATFNDSAEPQPGLATSWKHDADFKRWELQIRPGVKFHDGTPLTSSAVAAALERPGAFAQGDTVVIRSDQPTPALLPALSEMPIAKRTAEGLLIGSGPFRMVSDNGKRTVLQANEEYWAGRPYLDGVEVETGRGLREQLLDFELNKADVVEIGFGDLRRAPRSWTSQAVNLIALAFDPSVDSRMREAVALTIDRSTIHTVLLQRQGVPTGSILPQWLTGYSFLFPAVRDLDKARQLASGAGPLAVDYDPTDATVRLIAERIAVNAREAGITVRPSAGAKGPARIIRARVSSPDPLQALASVGSAEAKGSPYEIERSMLQGHRIVPLFHLPEIYGLGSRVRGWAPSRWGGWNLESVWLAP